MAIQIKKAVKYDAKLRLALAGPSGSGKTYTSLTLATALAGAAGVCVIDTERGSASKYADLFSFDVIDLNTFSPLNYIEAIKAVEQAGYGVLVIDSLSHAWNGPGGLLEQVEAITRRSQSKNSFNAWSEATPLQNKLIDAITRANLHVICTMRTKTEYVIEPNERGKSAPRKVGTAPVQRADVEYEFDVYADLDIDNTLIIHKSRCPELSGAVIAKPDGGVAETLKTWLSGAPVDRTLRIVPAPEPEPQPAPRQPQQSARTETPADSEPATEQQLSSIQKLCGFMQREVVTVETFADAKKAIQQLTADYREYRKSPPTNQNGTQPATTRQPEVQNATKEQGVSQSSQTQGAIAPSVVDKLKARVLKAYHVSEDQIEAKWSDLKKRVEVVADDASLTPANIARLNGEITTHERAQLKKF